MSSSLFPDDPTSLFSYVCSAGLVLNPARTRLRDRCASARAILRVGRDSPS